MKSTNAFNTLYLTLQTKNIDLYFNVKKQFRIADIASYSLYDKRIIREELNKMYQICISVLNNCPDGWLRISGTKAKPVFYFCNDSETGEKITRYLSKKNDINTIVLLSNKKYYTKLLKLISEEIERIDDDNFNFKKKYEVYDELNPKIRKYITPLLCSKMFAFDCWKNTEWVSNDYKNEKLIFETNCGINVRSKSEKMIVDLLSSNSNLVFKYDKGIYLENNDVIVFPDFIILNIVTGRIYIWEHHGMLDKAEYSNDFVRKFDKYINNGFVLGIDLMLTLETSEVMYNSRVVVNILNNII